MDRRIVKIDFAKLIMFVLKRCWLIVLCAELGFGASVGYYHVEESGTIWDLTTNEIYDYESKENKFGYFFFGDIGYRYQPTHGMVFRVGVSPSFNFDDSHSIYKAALYPYISFGFTI